jgi:CPA2 family monovalent cation:H+ antiporter-2
MQNIDLILTLTGSLAAALVCGYVTIRLGLSPIVGYLLAGVVVGPYTPGFVADRHLAEQLAEVGVILLMFGVGLQFHLKELLAVRRVAVPGATVQSLVATVLGTLLGLALGWSWSAGIVFGLCISVASTVVLMRVLADNGDLHTPTGHIGVGWLVVEDILTVFVVVLLPTVFGHKDVDSGGLAVAGAVGIAALKLAAMVGLTFLVGGRLIPWLLDRVAATRSRELFTLTVLVVALGIAVGSAKLFDVSMALGAFLAGMVVGRSEFSLRAATEALPMRDAFAVLFFVSVGVLFSPADLMESPALIAATLAIILLGKPLAALTIVLLLKYPLRTAVSVAVALAQVGEFSFILATAGRNLGVLDDLATNAIIAAAVISISLNPILYRLIDTIEPWLQRVLKTAPRKGPAGPSAESRDEDAGHRAIVIGYGPVGRTLARLLRANAIEPVVIELNLDTVRQLGGEGVRAIYGDASHRDTLVEARVEDAIAVILSSSSMHAGSETIRIARELNPKILTFARSNYLSEVTALRQAGADVVFSGEGEVALSMTEIILRQLGATPDQIDKERARVRADLFGGAAPDGGLPIGKTWPESAVGASLSQKKAPGSTDVS